MNEIVDQLKALRDEVKILRNIVWNPPKPPKKKLYVHPMDVASIMMSPRADEYEIISYVPVP